MTGSIGRKAQTQTRRGQAFLPTHPAVRGALSAMACTGDFLHLHQNLSSFHGVLEKNFELLPGECNLDGTLSTEYFNMEAMLPSSRPSVLYNIITIVRQIILAE
jgi:hypothetical protein